MTDEETREEARKLFGEFLMTDEKMQELQRKIDSGELVVVSHDDLHRKRHPLVPLEKTQEDLKRLLKK